METGNFSELGYGVEEEIAWGRCENSKKSTRPNILTQRFKEELSHVKLDNSIKSLKVEQLISEIQSFAENNNSASKILELQGLIRETNEKIKEENLTLVSYGRIKDREFNKVLETQRKLKCLQENYEKYERKCEIIMQSKVSAINYLSKVRKEVARFAHEKTFEKAVKSGKLEIKQSQKRLIQTKSQKLVESIAKISEKKKLKKTRIEEIFAKAAIKVHENKEYEKNSSTFRGVFRRVIGDLEKGKRFLKEFDGEVIESPIEVGNKLVALFSAVEFRFISGGNRLNELSAILSLKTTECNLLANELNIIKQPILTQKSEKKESLFTQESTKIQDPTEETLLIKIYVKLSTYLSEITSKLNIINENSIENNSNLFPQLEELTNTLKTSSGFYKHRTQKIPNKQRSQIKTKTLKISNFQVNLHLSTESQNDLKRIRERYFTTFPIHFRFLQENIMIALFLKENAAEKYLTTADEVPPDLKLLQIYSLSHSNLRSTLEKALKRTTEIITWAQPQIPKTFSIPKLNFTYQTKKILKKSQYTAIAETSKTRKISKNSPNFQLRKRHTKITNSHSPQLTSQTSLDTLQEIKAIDKRLKTIKMSEQKSSLLHFTQSKLKLPNISVLSVSKPTD